MTYCNTKIVIRIRTQISDSICITLWRDNKLVRSWTYGKVYVVAVVYVNFLCCLLILRWTVPFKSNYVELAIFCISNSFASKVKVLNIYNAILHTKTQECVYSNAMSKEYQTVITTDKYTIEHYFCSFETARSDGPILLEYD